MSSRRLVLLAGAIGAVVFAVLAVAWATKERDFTASVVQPPSVTAVGLVPVPSRATVCINDATITPDSEVMRVRIGTVGKPGVPLDVTITAPRYTQTGRIDGGSYRDNDVVSMNVDPPGSAVHARVCLRNAGRHEVQFYGTEGEGQTLSRATVKGRDVGPTPELAFAEAERHTVASRASDIVEGMATFRPGIIGAWLLWPLLFVLLLGVPAAVVWALWRSLDPDA